MSEVREQYTEDPWKDIVNFLGNALKRPFRARKVGGSVLRASDDQARRLEANTRQIAARTKLH